MSAPTPSSKSPHPEPSSTTAVALNPGLIPSGSSEGDMVLPTGLKPKRQSGFRSWLLRPWFLVVIDIAVFAMFFVGFAYFRGEFGRLQANVWVSAAACLLVCLLSISLVGAYDSRSDMTGGRFASEFLIGAVAGSTISIALVYAVLSFGGPQNVGRATTGLTLVGFFLIALWIRRRLHPTMRYDQTNVPFWVLGTGAMAQDLAEVLRRGRWNHPLRCFSVSGERSGEPLLATEPVSPRNPRVESEMIESLKSATGALGGIVVAEDFSRIPPSIQQKLVSLHFQGLQVLTLDSFYSRYWKYIPVAELTPAWALSDGFQLARNPVVDRVKRLLDLSVGGALFLGGVLLLPLIALIIRLESPGPIIFRQQRVGLLGKRFTVYKFRSMRIGSEKGDSYTRQGDKRVTRFGYFLRKSRLDELPQVWNVLKGEMSVIGPRAEWDQLVEKYEKLIPYYNFRHLVKPGITGWAQVNYPYGENERDAVEKLKYDLYYVRHYSVLLDFSIVLKTIYIMCGGKGQ